MADPLALLDVPISSSSSEEPEAVTVPVDVHWQAGAGQCPRAHEKLQRPEKLPDSPSALVPPLQEVVFVALLPEGPVAEGEGEGETEEAWELATT